MTAARRNIFFLFGALALLTTVANAQGVPPYDGTGSHLRGASPIQPYDSARHDALVAAAEAQRQAYADGTAANHPQDMINLAAMLESGVTSAGFDRSSAMDLYEKAAGLGNDVGQQKMCVAYLLGEGRPVDRRKASGFCNALPEGDPAHLFALAYDTDHNSHPADEDSSILQTYIDASKAGSADAMDLLGQKALALSSPEAARNWFRQGAALGSADATDHLAAMAASGQGGDADSDEAYWLYVNAANRGNADAIAWIAAAPASHQPLDRMGYDPNSNFIRETVPGVGGTHDVHLSLEMVANALTSVFPAGAAEGDITVHCYISTRHTIDVCLPISQLPPGTHFIQSLNWLFYRQLSVADKDPSGLPTAHTILALAFHWVR